MREITIPFTETHGIKIDLHAALTSNDGKRIISLGVTETAVGSKLLSIARDNAGKIIYGAASLEHQMQNGITNFLFGIGYPCTIQRNFFTRNIIESSYLEFNSKFTIYIRVLETMNILKEKKEKDELEQKLRRVMRYRNAMAHGKMKSIDGKIVIEYYQGEIKSDVMDDAYLSKLEIAFKDAYESVMDYNNKICSCIESSMKSE